MFDVGFFEMLVIGVVALLVIGPERLPDVARTIGRWVGRTRRFIGQVKSDIDREIQQEELRKAIEDNVPLDEIKQIMNKEIMSTDRFTLEEEDEKPEYQVKAIPDETSEKEGEQDIGPINGQINEEKLASDDHNTDTTINKS